MKTIFSFILSSLCLNLIHCGEDFIPHARLVEIEPFTCNKSSVVKSKGFKVQSIERKVSTRTKRGAHEYFEEDSCQELIEEYERIYKKVYFDNMQHSIREGLSYQSPKIKQDIPVSVYAQIHLNHLSSIRKNFGREFFHQMKYMQAINGDQRGHLVPFQLGGPLISMNMAPQTTRVNSNLGKAEDTDIERRINIGNSIRRHLETHHCGYVDWTVVLNYDFVDAVNLDNPIPSPRRPKGFKLCLEYFENQVDEQPIHQFTKYYNNNE